MPRNQWATPDPEPPKAPVDSQPGANLSRRRFVELALFTSASVVLSHALPAAARAAGEEARLPQPDTRRSELPCSPAETMWDVPETGFDIVEVIEPGDLARLDKEYTRDALT